MESTKSQKMAQAAFQTIKSRELTKEFASFARSFPALIHACGLAQALAFGHEKQPEYLNDLAAVLVAAGHREASSAESLAEATRKQPVAAYVRLSRNALQAAGWLKRYAEAFKAK